MKLFFQQLAEYNFTVNFHIHRPIVFHVAENIAQNNSFEKYKVTPASKVSPFDGKIIFALCEIKRNPPLFFYSFIENACDSTVNVFNIAGCYAQCRCNNSLQ